MLYKLATSLLHLLYSDSFILKNISDKLAKFKWTNAILVDYIKSE